MTYKRKRLLLIATFIIIAAITIVICVGYFTRGRINEFDGTLVDSGIENIKAESAYFNVRT